MATKSYSNLAASTTAWNKALRNFAIVTVMNAGVYDIIEGMTIGQYKQISILQDGTTTPLTDFLQSIFGTTFADTDVIDFSKLKANEILALYLNTEKLAELKYLKTSNATQEGPTKTITGGQNASTLVKYGKTARLEMQDALGNAEALEALAGVTVEYFRQYKATNSTLKERATDVIHATATFAGHKAIIGETFLIDADNSAQVHAYIMFYDFLSDSVFNLTQDAEGDATVFDMNGDLKEVKILIGDNKWEGEGTAGEGELGDEKGIVTGTFYSILPQLDYTTNPQVIEYEEQAQ